MSSKTAATPKPYRLFWPCAFYPIYSETLKRARIACPEDREIFLIILSGSFGLLIVMSVIYVTYRYGVPIVREYCTKTFSETFVV
ncbi:hypothetical protein SNEBB_006292 [Seison nebaliae]|nr:hypothetical protein SNEBB_006292 [Seison nebaliae]